MPSAKTARKTRGALKKRKVDKRLERFLGKLQKAAQSYEFSALAKALFYAYGTRQSQLLDYLRTGALVASIRVAPTEILRIPPDLWISFPDRDFKVRTLRKGKWKRRRLYVPDELLERYVSQPLEQYLSGHSKADADVPSIVAHILDRSGDELAGNNSACLGQATEALSASRQVSPVQRNAIVVPCDLHHFVYGTLAPILGPAIGRRGIGKPQEFILEAVRRIEIFRQRNKSFKLPGKKLLERELSDWWHDVSTVPARPKMSSAAVKLLVGQVRAAYGVPDEI
jgi:hypothetical protein